MVDIDKLKTMPVGRGTRKQQAMLDKRMPLGLQLNGDEGHITIDIEGPVPDAWGQILETNPYVSPETHEVDPLRGAEITSWDVSAVIDGEWVPHTNHRCKVPVRLRRPGQRLTQNKVDELTRLIRRRTSKPTPPATQNPWLVVCLADLQLGKGDYGGTEACLQRVRESFATIRQMVLKQKPAGVCIVDLGDLIEQVSCFYDDQAHTVDLDLTAQIDLAIETILAGIEAVYDLTPQVIYGAVPSNHGEFRVGKATTVTDKARDNADLVIANAIARILAANPDRYGHCHVWTPPRTGGDPYVLTLDLDGVMLAFTHGHQIAAGKGRMQKVDQWWQNHQWSDRQRLDTQTEPTAADADILVCGHGHVLLMSQATGKLAIQCPAAEDGSEWYTTTQGGRSSAGVLTFNVSDQWALLANHFQIT